MTSPLFLRIHPSDNVAVALRAVEPGVGFAGVGFAGVRTLENIPAGHKLALRAISVGEPVVKYGHPIGVASAAIPAGAHVHSHNIRGNLPEKLASLRFADVAKPLPASAPRATDTFLGYRRPD